MLNNSSRLSDHSHTLAADLSRPQRKKMRVAPHHVPLKNRRSAAAQSIIKHDELAVKLLPLVRRVACEMRERLPQHVELEELTGAGVLGLLDAVRRFDARKHVKIETYARHRIRGAILDSLREMDPVSRDMRRKNKQAESVYHELESQLGRPVADDEMARALGVSLKKWYETMHKMNGTGVEWMRPSQMPEATAVHEENIPASDRDNPFDLCYRAEQQELVNRAAASLPERDRKVIELYYQREMTMKQIGEEISVDESRVSQIHSAALTRLRNRVRRMLQPGSSACPPVFMLTSPPIGTRASLI